ncbi:expressed unknown protein [Seminavis robusta]|uniref:Uncharacterized protein n=1 Tax=Seminavis robusta TaxID=568900 RepID=A0A9N8D6G4_9STRA|nr:expressed unknown protein [Seminavis robusta]|eukprot:Sro18_g012940.1 n/a (265) ;mRNA; f:105666-106460
MEVLGQCIELNTQAIIRMREGKFVESSLMLNNALEKLELCLQEPSPQSMYTTSPTRNGHPSSSSHGRHSASPVTDISEAAPSEQAHGSCQYTSVSIESPLTNQIVKKATPENVFSFYPRMFHVTCKGRADPMELMKITMIVMFNEALARHAIALMYLSQCKVNPEKHLTRVLGLYQKIMVLAQSCFQYSDVREMLCVLVAATNNYGHISSQLLLFNETRESINHIIQLLALSNEHSFLPDDVRLFFESVCIFLEGRTLRNAPAA